MGKYNQPLYNLPSHLQVLMLGGYCNQPLDNLPPKLECLLLRSEMYVHPLNHLPASLRRLYMSKGIYYFPLSSLPQQLTHLAINTLGDFDNVPPNISYLETENTKTISHLPSSLISLVLPNYNAILPPLPQTLKYLRVPLCENYELPLPLPPYLSRLELNNKYCFSTQHVPATVIITKYVPNANVY
jgi:hypothetical protein